MSRRSEYYLGSKGKYVQVGSDCVLYHAYWDGNAVDHSTGGNNGTVVGAAYVENGLHFDSGDDWVWVTVSAGLKPTEAITIHIWANSDTWEDYSGVIWNTWAWSDGYRVWKRSGTSEMGYQINNTSAYMSLVTAGTWGLYTLVYDKVNITPYVNASAGTPVAYSTSISYSSQTKMSIGSDIYLDGPTYYFGGTIGEVLIFNTAHASTAVMDYFNLTKSRYGVT